MLTSLSQTILTTLPEPYHDKKDVFTLLHFLELLKEEEDYFIGEQHNTALMITRLRKIFYDQWGWNRELIRGAASVEGRYLVNIVDDPATLSVPIPENHTKKIRHYSANTYQPKHRVITYRADDRVYGNTRVNQVPEIYKNDHQEIVLPEGYYCDIAHVLAGLDASNHQQVVSPLPSFLSFLNKLVPHVDSNIDIVTWLGDIASSSGDFLFCYLKTNKQPVPVNQEQRFIDMDAPGSDMLGDIDPYVIRQYYDVLTTNGRRITDIFSDYYEPDKPGFIFRQHRFSSFSKSIGLIDWNGDYFANEQQWLARYRKQLRDNVSFQVYSLTEENVKSIFLSLGIWLNGYQDVLKLDLLLQIFLNALKECIKRESTIH